MCGVGLRARRDSSVLGVCFPASAEGRGVVVLFGSSLPHPPPPIPSYPLKQSAWLALDQLLEFGVHTLAVSLTAVV